MSVKRLWLCQRLLGQEGDITGIRVDRLQCCRRRKSEEHLDADCCCTAWCVIIATLVCR